MSKLLCVYCASSDRLDSKYYDAATELGREMVAHGWGLVYGGGKTGVMGAVARSVKQAGGRVVGVIPEFMKARELAYDEADELVTVITMRERKLLMETRADAFVALPGGWGTMEEFFEVLTWGQLGLHQKPCGLLNVDGYFDGLLRYLDHAMTEQLLKAEHRAMLIAAPSPGELLDRLASYQATVVTKWMRGPGDV